MERDPLLRTIHSDGSEEFVSPFGPEAGREVCFRFRLDARLPLQKALFRWNGNGRGESREMRPEKEMGHLTYYAARTRIPASPFHYRFEMLIGGCWFHLNAVGLHASAPPDLDDFKLVPGFKVPGWLGGRVFYQIFPDRFRDSDPAGNVKSGEYAHRGHSTIARRWGEPPLSYEKAFNLDFFGGDLEGIRQAIPHLLRLGVNAVWLNPVFLSPSNHKYDTQDYHVVDPHLGGREDLIRLIEALHKEDIRIILDGVFNHTGSSHPWFNREGLYPEAGAWQEEDSPYEGYYVRRGAKSFHYWGDFDTLPTLNYASRGLRDAIYGRVDSVAQKYLRPPFSADGWRLDVAEVIGRHDGSRLDREVWPEFRAAVKSAAPEAYILGECGEDPAELLQGNALDGAMNYYGFCLPVRWWLAGGTGEGAVFSRPGPSPFRAMELDQWFRRAAGEMSRAPATAMYNLLGSHDCRRILDHCDGDLRKLRLAYLLLFTQVGLPALYYGDEVPLRGSLTIESARESMEWNEENWHPEHFRMIQKLVALRKKSAALSRGGILTLAAEGDLFCYARFWGGENRIVLLHNSPEERVCSLDLSPLALAGSGKLRDALGGRLFSYERHRIEIRMAGYDALLLSDE